MPIYVSNNYLILSNFILTNLNSTITLLTKRISCHDRTNRLTPVALSGVILSRHTVLVVEVLEHGRVSVVVVQHETSADAHESAAAALATLDDVATEGRAAITARLVPLQHDG